MNTAPIIIICILFGLYGWTAAVECGVSFLRLLPRSTFTKQGLRLFRPMWRLTSLYLLLSCAVFGALFYRTSSQVLRSLGFSLLVGFLALLLRAGFILFLFHTKARTGLTWQNLVLSVLSFIVPASFGVAGIMALTGRAFWGTATGWLMLICLLWGLIAMALSFVYFVVGRTPHDRLHQVSRWLNVGFGVAVTIGLQRMVWRQFVHLHATSFVLFVAAAGFIVLLQAGLWFAARERYMWWYLSLFSVTTPLLFELANRPFLLYPTLLQYQQQRGIVVISVSVGSVLVIVASAAYVRRLIHLKLR
jgi:hypothetical protein